MTIPELEALGYTVTKTADDTWQVKADGVLIYVTGDDLIDLTLPDTSQVALDQTALAAKPLTPVFDPVAAVAALDPKTATAADIINAIRGQG